jgi:hypothetical protein
MENPSSDLPIADRGLTRAVASEPGNVRSRTYYEGPAEIHGDVRIHRRYFTYRTESGVVAGSDFNVMFTVDAPTKKVWPCFKDFNLWQNSHRYYYSGILGDLEGKTFSISKKPDDTAAFHRYRVLKVIPEYLLIMSQEEPGPGMHVFILNEHDGKTIICALMEHSSKPEQVSEEIALKPWRDEGKVSELQRKWPDGFIPTLKKIVGEGS